MHQLARLALGGHKVVPAPRDVRLFVQAQNAPGDGVAVMMVVKQPAVKAGLADCRLAATIPSGKVYRLKADATAKQDETSATVVFDAAKLDAATAGQEAAKAGDAKPRQGRTTSGI
jgi:hypothetical protein